MIVAVGSDKGSPGATTLAAALGVVWPGERLVCELDPRGADLPFRLMGADGRHLAAAPSVATLAIDARPGAAAPQLARYAQQTALGVPVIRGEVSSRAAGKITAHLPAIAGLAASWPGVVITDVGSLQPSNPALVAAKAASIVLLVTRADTEGLGHLRDRVDELAGQVGDPARGWTSLGVVLVAAPREQDAAVQRTRALLDSVGSPAPVVGAVPHDPIAAAALWAGPVSRRVLRGPLIRSAERLLAGMWQLWPDALGEQYRQPPNGQPPAGHAPVDPPASRAVGDEQLARRP